MGVQNIQNHVMYQSAQGTKGIQKQEPVSAPAAPEDKTANQSEKAIHDEYIHGEKPEPTGLYELTHDEEGNPKIRFDSPVKKSTEGGLEEPLEEPLDEPSKEPSTEAVPAKDEPGKATETTTVNTDKVDREIEKLKEKRNQLEQQIQTTKDPEKAEDLERQLSQIENELVKKDNDAYRRQNAVIS